jgi:hypothetical protein
LALLAIYLSAAPSRVTKYLGAGPSRVTKYLGEDLAGYIIWFYCFCSTIYIAYALMFLVSKSGDPSGVHLSSSVYKW